MIYATKPENYLNLQYEWQAATYIYYHCITKLINRPMFINISLTKRETECLQLTANSFRVRQIAEKLNISSRTVNFHIQNANKKLGVNNKYNAILKYLSLNIKKIK